MLSEMNDSELIYERANLAYRGYQQKLEYGWQEVQTSDDRLQWEDIGEKVHTPRRDHKNTLRFGLAIMGMVTMIVIAVLCMLSDAGAVSWLGFGIASFAIFLTAFMTIEKIQ